MLVTHQQLKQRILSVSGVADAIHIAVYYIGAIVAEPATTSNAPSSSNTSYRPSGGSHRSQASSYYPSPSTSSNNVPSYSALAAQPGSQTQQIFIPNELVGSIIGKGGSRINEIRQASNSHIKILEPGERVEGGIQGNPGERVSYPYATQST
jgi:heterogeneous nuclear rnp K-like protein